MRYEVKDLKETQGTGEKRDSKGRPPMDGNLVKEGVDGRTETG